MADGDTSCDLFQRVDLQRAGAAPFAVGQLLVKRGGYALRDTWGQVRVVAMNCGLVGIVPDPMGLGIGQLRYRIPRFLRTEAVMEVYDVATDTIEVPR